MDAWEDWLNSPLLSVYEKQKLMGFTDQDIMQIFQELKDEMMATITWPKTTVPFSGLRIGSALPTPAPDQKIYNDDSRIIKIIVIGKNCKIIEGSDLHLKIKDLISWLVIDAVDNHKMTLDSSGTALDNLKNDKTFFHAIEEFLTGKLTTTIKIIQVQAFKQVDYLNSLNETILIGVTITLDQSYIDNYTDSYSEDLIDVAMRFINES